MEIKLRNMTACYIARGDEMLMLYRVGSRVGKDSWRGIGGHFEQEELNDPMKCVLRELHEEVGICKEDLDGLRMRYVTLRRSEPGEIRQNYYFFAELKKGAEVNMRCAEGELKWVKTKDLLNLEMPHTAFYMLEHYLHTGKDTDAVYCGTTVWDGVRFAELEMF